jgi:hypothetical protein
VDTVDDARRKRQLVEEFVAKRVDNFKVSGAKLFMGEARFVALKTLEVTHNGSGSRRLRRQRPNRNRRKLPLNRPQSITGERRQTAQRCRK